MNKIELVALLEEYKESVPADVTDEALNRIVSGDMITEDDVRTFMNKREKEMVLRRHPYPITQGSGKDKRWHTRVDDPSYGDRGRRTVRKATYEEVCEALYLIYKEEKQRMARRNLMNLETFYPIWLDHKSLQTTAGTYITKIRSDWKRYYEGTPIVRVPLEELTDIMLEDWALRLIRDNEMTKKQYYNMAVIMREALRYAVRKKYIPVSPFDQVHIETRYVCRKVVKKNDSTQVFSKEEIRKITDWAWDDFRNEKKIYVLSPLAVIFMMETGIRIGEVCALQYDDIVHGGQDIFIQRMVRRDEKALVDHPKTAAGCRYIPLTEKAMGVIDTCRKYQEEHRIKTTFIFSATPDFINERCIAELFRKYSKWLGGPMKSSHKCKKTVASKMLDGGMNINSVRKMMGHEDERTTLNNYCFDSSSDIERREKFRSIMAEK